MPIDPLLPVIVATSLICLLLAGLCKLIRQPLILAYIITGIIVGPQYLALISNTLLIEHLGSLGVILLLFFVGMEIKPIQLKTSGKIAVIGTCIQITISFFVVWLVGHTLNWSLERVILIAFVISLSSTAVVLKLLQDKNELHTKVGQSVLGILLVQDLAVIPMFLVLGLFGAEKLPLPTILLQLFGGAFIVCLVYFLMKKSSIHFPKLDLLATQHELQVFIALICCFGFSLITGEMYLSTAFGAFMGGMVVGNIKQLHWVKIRLDSFHIVFLVLFFMSIGMLLDVNFFIANWRLLGTLLLIVLICNTIINTLTLKLLKLSWKDSVQAGALLAQIGEFSFILATIGKGIGIISTFGYQVTISVVVLSLFASPMWVSLLSRVFKYNITTR
ncbi:MAG: cation:proton antiporter [Glaciecola sp.]|jgi:CPA2 family monovalent cation:H+ antiporter-2